MIFWLYVKKNKSPNRKVRQEHTMSEMKNPCEPCVNHCGPCGKK
jgi:hypothetical protein